MIVEAKGILLRRNWIPVVVSFALLAGGLLIAWASAMPSPFAYLAAWFGLVLAPLFYLRNAFPRAKAITFRAGASGITIDGAGEVRSEDILEAKLVPRRGPDALVELALRGRKTLTLRTATGDARAILELFGARRTRFRLLLSLGRRYLLSLLALFGLSLVLARGAVVISVMSLPGLLVYAGLLAWLVGLVRGRLVVGADGFTTRWLFRERFVAFRDVAAVEGRKRFGLSGIEDTVVALASGRRLRFRTLEAPNTEAERGAESRAMLAHMKEAFERSTHVVDGRVDVPSLVERGSRSAREWLSCIDALVRGGGSRYRVAAVSPEILSDLASDPTATTESRIGAAAALVRMDDEALRTRVRVAAEACAESELRDALLALADARDDEAAEAALAAFRR